MIDFRKEFYGDNRFAKTEQIKAIIDNEFSDTIKHPRDNSGELADLQQKVDNAVAAAKGKPNDTFLRLKKVIAIATLRDFEYGQRGYKFLKGAGYTGLSVEKYISSDKLTKYSGELA